MGMHNNENVWILSNIVLVVVHWRQWILYTEHQWKVVNIRERWVSLDGSKASPRHGANPKTPSVCCIEVKCTLDPVSSSSSSSKSRVVPGRCIVHDGQMLSMLASSAATLHPAPQRWTIWAPYSRHICCPGEQAHNKPINHPKLLTLKAIVTEWKKNEQNKISSWLWHMYITWLISLRRTAHMRSRRSRKVLWNTNAVTLQNSAS